MGRAGCIVEQRLGSRMWNRRWARGRREMRGGCRWCRCRFFAGWEVVATPVRRGQNRQGRRRSDDDQALSRVLNSILSVALLISGRAQVWYSIGNGLSRLI